MIRLLLLLLLNTTLCFGATIAIIDTGFDLDHDYLKPNILKNETDEEAIDFHGWDFFDNSHMKSSVIPDQSLVQEILLFRSLRAKGHRQGLSLEEFEWFKKKSADKNFMEQVRLFKKHAHGTFVAGIALREGENIHIFPIRGLNIPSNVVAVEDASSEKQQVLKEKTPEKKFEEEIKNSLNRISRKFSKICAFIAKKKIEVVNASYGITYKSIMTKFRERHLEITGKEIEETKLRGIVDDYFRVLYERGQKTMLRYPRVLFVFSAGNSALDNDLYHHYPSKIKIPNAIAVAAMNGDYIATFSNYGLTTVDIGAPGVAILSILPKIYTQNGNDLYSPSSGTSMAAPYVSNLAAQILNTNPKLKPQEIKKIILETGEIKPHLKTRLISGAIADNKKAIRAALLSKDMPLDQAIILGSSDLIPVEDKISIGNPKAGAPEDFQKKIMDSVPSLITPQEVEDETLPAAETPTKEQSSLPKDGEIKQPDNLEQPLLKAPGGLMKPSDPDPSNQIEEQSQTPFLEKPASSSELSPQHPETQLQDPLPSSQQL